MCVPDDGTGYDGVGGLEETTEGGPGAQGGSRGRTLLGPAQPGTQTTKSCKIDNNKFQTRM